MGRKRELKQGAGALPPGAAAPGPNPADRMVRSGRVKVRARQAIGELIDGEMKRFAAGEEFECPEERVAALGDSVERQAGPATTAA